MTSRSLMRLARLAGTKREPLTEKLSTAKKNRTR